jgi:hypothetical protein
MTSRSSPPSSGTPAFPQPRLNRRLSKFIDQALILAVRHPGQAKAMLFSMNIDAATVARLMSNAGRRRPIMRTPNGVDTAFKSPA